ncbi:MAG: serine hydrolase [Eubacteriales bacterium]|nr:serine hydrolase [Eubacteriales bacterium]
MKKRSILCCFGFLLTICILTGCHGFHGLQGVTTTIKQPFGEYYAKSRQKISTPAKGMAEDLAVLSKEEEKAFDLETKDYADLLINDTKNEVITSYHCFKKLYPASITKIMTALLTLENANLSDEIVLDHDIVMTEDGAVISTLTKGDTVTVEQVLRTMLVKSANDCAVILAEHIAGSTEKFAKLMNQRALELGATSTHFVNANGLHDDDHYTTAYDLYLIFKKVVEYDVFVDIVSMKDNTMTYKNRFGQDINEYMQSTNYFLLNEYPVPKGVVMYGGKTGTTSVAKSCLILMTENEEGERFFSVVLGAKTKGDLYNSMAHLLEKTTK